MKPTVQQVADVIWPYDRKLAVPLSVWHKITAYLAQTGRRTLTARQARRVRHAIRGHFGSRS